MASNGFLLRVYRCRCSCLFAAVRGGTQLDGLQIEQLKGALLYEFAIMITPKVGPSSSTSERCVIITIVC